MNTNRRKQGNESRLQIPRGVFDALWHGIRREISFARDLNDKELFFRHLDRIKEAMDFYREHAEFVSETLEKEYADLLKFAEEKSADRDPQPAG